MRHTRAFLTLTAFAFALLAVPAIALGVDGGVVTPSVAPVVTPAATVAATATATPLPVVSVAATPPSTPGDILQGLLSAFQTRSWVMLAALLCIGLTALLRWVAPKVHGKLGAFLATNRGGSALVLVTGVLGAVGTALYGKTQVNLQIVLSGVIVGVLASGGWNVVWDLLSPNDKPVSLEGATVSTPNDPPKAA